jgi:hypothetical protein
VRLEDILEPFDECCANLTAELERLWSGKVRRNCLLCRADIVATKEDDRWFCRGCDSHPEAIKFKKKIAISFTDWR